MTRQEQIVEAALEEYFPFNKEDDRRDAFIKGAEWADKTMLDKVCKYLFENYHGEKLSLRMIEDLRKAMEEQQ